MSAVVPLEVRVAQAQRAAASGQIRMAEIYTARALQLVAIEKAETRKAMGIAKRRLRNHRMDQSLSGFVDGVMEIFQEICQPAVDFVVDIAKKMAVSPPSIHNDYVLVPAVDLDQRLLDAMYAVQSGEPLNTDQRRFL